MAEGIMGILQEVLGPILSGQGLKAVGTTGSKKHKAIVTDVFEIKMDEVIEKAAVGLMRMIPRQHWGIVQHMTGDIAKLIWARLTPDDWRISNQLDNARNRFAVVLSLIAKGERPIPGDEVADFDLASLKGATVDEIIQIASERMRWMMVSSELVPNFDHLVRSRYGATSSKKPADKSGKPQSSSGRRKRT
ncbi:MAG: hypothetical protein ABII24_03075 [bacterium]